MITAALAWQHRHYKEGGNRKGTGLLDSAYRLALSVLLCLQIITAYKLTLQC